jgi:Na+-driven multidrug efflux pump
MALAIPARLGFTQASQFLQAQRIMRPSAQLSVMSCLLNLAGGLFFVLGIPAVAGFRGLGFVACPVVTVSCEYIQLAVLLLVFFRGKGLHRECWPDGGWSCAHLTRAR